jgi:hypothetical protein
MNFIGPRYRVSGSDPANFLILKKTGPRGQYLGALNPLLGRRSGLHIPEAILFEDLFINLPILNKMGFRPFHDAKGPVLPSSWIRHFSDRNGYS